MDGALGRSPVHPIKRNGSAHVPAGTGTLVGCSPTKLLRGSDDLPVEQLSGFQHGMHDNGKLPRHRDGSALEADALSELQAPLSQGAFSSASGQDHAGGLEKKASDLVVTSSGDMAVVVDLTGLISSCGQAKPSADRTRRPEVGRIFNCGGEGRGSDDADAGDRHEQLAGLASARIFDQPSGQLGSTQTDAAPRLQQRPDDRGKLRVFIKSAPHIRLEGAALACRHDQTEGLHQPTDLVGELGLDSDQLGSRCHQRAGQHAFEAFDPDLTIKADLGEMGEPIGIIGVGLVRSHVEGRLSVTRIYADDGQPFGSERMVEPYRQRAGFEDDPIGLSGVLADRPRDRLRI